MENNLKRWYKRFFVSAILAVVLLLSVALVVLAIPDSVTNLSGTATDITVDLLWVKAVSSNSTVIRYDTTTYPANPAAGTSAYSGTSYYTTVTGLTAGTPYYFSAWGYDGSDYSANVTTLVITTEGFSSENTTIPMSEPALPAEVFQNPDASGWSIAPLDWIATYFAEDGLDMPVNNLWMTIASIIVTFIGIGTYVKWRSFAASWFLIFIASLFCVTIEVMQGLVIIIELGIGMGVLAIERYYQ